MPPGRARPETTEELEMSEVGVEVGGGESCRGEREGGGWIGGRGWVGGLSGMWGGWVERARDGWYCDARRRVKGGLKSKVVLRSLITGCCHSPVVFSGLLSHQ